MHPRSKPRQVFLLAALLTPMLLLSTAGAQQARKPNFVIIFIDDLGYGDIGPFGATKQKTPNLDRMAREGMKLTSFYAAPVCSVSRAQLLTGCYGVRVSVPGVFPPASKNGLHPSEFTVAERLKEHGYATACIGKWHLGDQPEFLPTRQGFDRYFGIPYSNDMQRRSKETGGRVVPLLRDEKVIDLLTEEKQSRLVEQYTTEAVQFIKESKDRPFLLYLPHTAVHTPIHPGAAFSGKSANGRFGDWVEEMDWSVGRILDTLKEQKLSENTLVLFTSDNGPWLIKGSDGGNAGPLRGGKGSTWEGGVRVPTLAWWPGKIAPGSTCDAPAGTIDLLPTLVGLSGGKVPPEPVIDGRSLEPLLFGRSKESPREAHYYFAGLTLQAVRQGPWKLAIAAQPGAGGDTPRLYNLDQEIGEQTNRAEQHPEIVARLQALAVKMNAEIGGAKPSARRPAGEAANPTTLYASIQDPPREATRPANLEALQPGEVVASAAAPQIGGKPFTLSLTVETDQKDAVLVSHGGSALGYALHLNGGRVVFSIRTSRETVTDVTSSDPIAGNARIIASLAADGKMSLAVNDQPPVAGMAPGLISRQPQEPFCLGHDSANPVAVYSAKVPFKGKITGLKFTSP